MRASCSPTSSALKAIQYARRTCVVTTSVPSFGLPLFCHSVSDANLASFASTTISLPSHPNLNLLIPVVSLQIDPYASHQLLIVS